MLLYKTFAVKFQFLSRLFCLNQNDFILFKIENDPSTKDFVNGTSIKIIF